MMWRAPSRPRLRVRAVPFLLVLVVLAGCLSQPEEVETSAIEPPASLGTMVALTPTPSVFTVPAGGWVVVHARIGADQWEEDEDGSGSYRLAVEVLEGEVIADWSLRLQDGELAPLFLSTGPMTGGWMSHSSSGGPKDADLVWVFALSPDSPEGRIAIAMGDDAGAAGADALAIASGEGAIVSSYSAFDPEGSREMTVEDSRPTISTPRGLLFGPGTFRATFSHAMDVASMHGFDAYVGNTYLVDWSVTHTMDGDAASDAGTSAWPFGPALSAEAAGVSRAIDAEIVLDTRAAVAMDQISALTIPWDPAEAGWRLDVPLGARGNPVDGYEHARR